ncbi:hypothetical protein Pan153_61160 [Gimesia panareensis]|uniref:Uncharacterized protein n=1 Tax=Gimesia panareensis TaxID=2527978 RepID=A0A518FYI6_9PLAN|nr:hypothetical protein [Gimesia panareensis]QDV21428.1 hypothetical protein Pan153_61160 [Gimesia panareensis]
MILIYGDYQHPDNEANVIISRQGLEAEDGFIYGYTETWNITGVMHAETDKELVTKMAQLVEGYEAQGKDLTWKKGSTIMHQLVSLNTLAGTRVTVPPHFPRNGNGELTTFRSYAMTVEADINFTQINLEEPQVLKYEESLNYTGTGGAKFFLLPTIKGAFQKQQLTESSPVQMVQSGMKVGLGAYPAANAPLFPYYEHVDRRQVNYAATRRRNGLDIEFPTHWSYTFEHNAAF